VVSSLYKIERQDSLLRIAAMPESERTDYIKKLVRQIRRQQGMKDEESTTGRSGRGGDAADDVFNPQTKGDWYFYNPVLKKQGVGVFKQEWGNRPNVDNWRRASDVTSELRSNSPDNTRGNPTVGLQGEPAGITSFETLLANVPLTPDQVKISDDVLATSFFSLGTAYLNDLEDYLSAIQAFETIRERFPDYGGMGDVLFRLYFAYTKTGNAQKAAEVKALLLKNFPTSRQATIVSTGIDPGLNKPTGEVTKLYEGIYDLFIEGRFEEAISAKKHADSTYKTNFWSPQLLYIEAVYHVKAGEDSIAKNTLSTIVRQQPNTPLADKAGNMIKVLNRRKEIEQELRNLNITRPPEDTMVYVPPHIEQPTAVRRDTTRLQTNTVVINQPAAPAPRRDTLVNKPVVTPPPSSSYTYDANAAQFVVLILNKVDNVFGNEARNAFNRYNKERYYNLPLTSQVMPLDAENRLLLIGSFTNMMQATEYVQKAMPLSQKEIIPWLKADKYSYTIISEKNLEVLKTKTDLKTYKQFLEQNSGLKF
jgi:outer membrane protein assembly factor BamD (BamD/ComL family)